MRTTIDKLGRIVVPKPVRDQLGLSAGQELELSVLDGKIELEAPATPMRLIERRGHSVAETEGEMPVLSADLVRDTLERVRR